MAPNGKAASPGQGGPLGDAASNATAPYRSKTRRFRQRIKGLIIWAWSRGFLSYPVTDILIQRGGLSNV